MRNAIMACWLILPMAGPVMAAPRAGQGSGTELPWLIGPEEGRPTRPRPAINADLRDLGRSIYLTRCAGCHGDRGDGRGPLAAQLRPAPTDFGKGIYKVHSTPAGSLPTDHDLFRTLSRGMHGTAMQPWRELSEHERWALVQQLKSFSPRFLRERVPTPIAVPFPPRETSEMQDRGEALYVRARCSACHGDGGQGDGPVAERLRLAGDRQARARDFTRGRFLRGSEMEDLYLTLKVGVEGTPMPSYASLRDEEIWALASYVRLLIRERPWQEFPPARTTAAAAGRPRTANLRRK